MTQTTVTIPVDVLHTLTRRIKALDEESRLIRQTIAGLLPRIEVVPAPKGGWDLRPALKTVKKRPKA